MSFRKAALFLVVALAFASVATAENPFDLSKKKPAPAPGPDPIPVCWSLNATTCTSNSSCALCTFFSGTPTCFEKTVAKVLPPMIAQCTFGAVALEAAKPACRAISSSDECSITDGCTWCASTVAPSSCIEEAHARRLPADLFQCDFDASFGLKQFFGRYWV